MNDNPCSNHEVHGLSEHPWVFTLQCLKCAQSCLYDFTRKIVVAQTDHCTDAFILDYFFLWGGGGIIIRVIEYIRYSI